MLDSFVTDAAFFSNTIQLSQAQWIAVMFTLSLFTGIVVAYKPYGSTGIACIMSQIVAIIGVQLSSKALMSSGFKYPMCLSTFHFFFVCVATACVQLYQLNNGVKDKMVMMLEKQSEYATSARWYFERFSLIALMQCLNVVLNNTSLMHIGAGLNALIGILAPVLTALVACACGAHIATLGWIGIAIAVLGDGILSSEGTKNLMHDGSTLNLAVLGICLGIGAMFARSLRSVMMDAQMNHYSKDQNFPGLSPFEVVAFQSPLVFLMALVVQLSVEGSSGFMMLRTLSLYQALMLATSTFCAVFLTHMGMQIIKLLGASAAQIAGKLNVLVTVALSCTFLGETLSYGEILGAMIVLAGAAVFERSHQNEKNEESLPMSAEKPNAYQSA